MAVNLSQALENTNSTYQELVAIANDIVSKCLKDTDPTIKRLLNNIENISNDELRNYMLELSAKAWSLSEIKEKAALKAEVSKILQKEAYSKEFNGADGTVAVRENLATLNISYEVLCQTVNDVVADILKAKLDELHRIVDTLKSIMMSRLSEAKLLSVTDGVTND
jgi:hypothetical protein